jgi:hypothetical protein
MPKEAIMNVLSQDRTPVVAAWRKAVAALCGVSLLVLLGGTLLFGAAQAPQAEAQAAQSGHVRIGTYDSRAVAVAYVRSEMSAQKMNDLVRRRDEAAKAKNTKLVKELEAQGASMQVRKHLQGFSTAPVEDVLDTVRDRLPAVAQHNNVIAITRVADYHADSVELVDVTKDLVALFSPDDKTLKIIEDLRKQPPLPIEVVAKMPADK